MVKNSYSKEDIIEKAWTVVNSCDDLDEVHRQMMFTHFISFFNSKISAIKDFVDSYENDNLEKE